VKRSRKGDNRIKGLLLPSKLFISLMAMTRGDFGR
jgi:hypothetical protein